jgi:precorrin-8X/cobalt-precorrin-8 methylmutase
MPFFDAYIMTDWSGGSRRRKNRQDAIWIAHGEIEDDSPQTESPSSRTEAIELIRALLHEWLTSRSRVLVCFDFAYGYPVDFAAALESATGKSDLPWRLVWQYLNEAVKDDMGTLPNRRPSNRSNRFEVANLINSALSSSREAAGPFWCSATEAAYLHIPQRRPDQPFASAQGYLIKPLRLTDKRAKSGTPFRLFGTASVGGQSITGIPRLYKLRNEPELAPRSAVWPFETGWAIKASWLPEHISIVHAEIYPSVREPKPDPIKDRGQVHAMWEWARHLDRQDQLLYEFARPADIDPGSKEDIAIQLTEGWILGSSPTIRHQ